MNGFTYVLLYEREQRQCDMENEIKIFLKTHLCFATMFDSMLQLVSRWQCYENIFLNEIYHIN